MYNENSDISKMAYKLSCNKMTTEEIFNILENGKDWEKPIAILNIENLDTALSQKLSFYLTDQKGPIREAVSSIFLEFSPQITENTQDKIISALLDVNPNVCRNMVEYLKKTNGYFIKDKVWLKTKEVLNDIEQQCSKFRKNKEKNHILNKKIFHLFWCLEALSTICTELSSENIIILQKTSSFFDYTIREKTAQILASVKNPPEDILNKLKADKNFYVRNKF